MTPKELRAYNLVRDNIDFCVGTNVEILNLSSRDLKYCPPEIGQLHTLRELRLDGNNLASLPKELFDLKCIRVLSITGNKFREIPPEIGQLESLKELYLNSNQIEDLPPELAKLKELKVLSLANNQLQSVPLETFNLKALEILSLSNNKLTELSPKIGQLITLRQIYLQSNQLESLPYEIAKLRHLSVVSLSGNQLSSFPTVILRLDALRHLSLDSNQLTDIPPEIYHLANLATLGLNKNHLENLPPEIGKLLALRRLSIATNKLVSLPPEVGCLTSLTSLDVGSNCISTLPPEIGKLSRLVILDASQNQLIRLPSQIGQLERLTHLNVHGNIITRLPPEISRLNNLSMLYLYSNRLKVLPAGIGQLRKLVGLYLQDNELASIPPQIGKLQALQELIIHSNQLASLPKEMEQLGRLTTLSLHNNPLLKLPPSVLGSEYPAKRLRQEISNPSRAREILQYYFDTVGNRGRSLREVKVILVGRGEVGKSSMVDGLMGKKFTTNRERTDGIAITTWRVALGDGNADLTLWDFGGQEIMHGTHQFFMTHRSIYIVMADGRHDRGRQDVEYWLKLVRAFGGDSPILVVLNRQKGHPFDVDREPLNQKYDVKLEHFFRTDCADGKTLTPLRESILAEASRMLAAEERFPASAWRIKTRLADMKKLGEDYLSEQRYQDLCAEHGVTDEKEQDKLLRRLSDLGTVVSFPDDFNMSALSVLNPEWATDGIYRVVTCESLREKRHGVLSKAALRKLLPRDRWPKPMHIHYVLELMLKFELCFRVDGDPDKVLVPELLPDMTPPLKDWDSSKCVVFHYQYTVLPHGVLPRFITRSHDLSTRGDRWRTGVILSDDGAEARIQADYDTNTLSIWVRGSSTGTRRDLLKVIRSNFEAIHARIEGLDPEEMVAVPGYPQILVPYRDVILDERDGQTTFRVNVDGKRIAWPISELLNGVESQTERLQAAIREKSIELGSNIFVEGNLNLGDHTIRKITMNNDNSINIEGNVTNSQVAHSLSECTNLIQQQSPCELKNLMEDLDRKVRELITQLPEEQQKKASKNLDLAIKTLTDVEPERDWYDVSAKGLLEASSYVKDFSGNIAETLTNLGKCVWKGFSLPH